MPALTVLALVALALGDIFPQRGANQPQIILDKIRHDFGDVFAGEELSHVFSVRNLGAAPLELSDRPLLTTKPSKVSFNPSSVQPAWAITPVTAAIRTAAPS